MAEFHYMTQDGLDKLKKELEEALAQRPVISAQIAEAREKGDLSENAEYDAAKDEQRNVEARIEELEKLLKNVEVVDNDGTDDKKVKFGSTVKILDKELKEELTYRIVGASEAKCLEGSISDESPLGRALIGSKKGETISVEAPCGVLKYKVIEIVKEKSSKK